MASRTVEAVASTDFGTAAAPCALGFLAALGLTAGIAVLASPLVVLAAPALAISTLTAATFVLDDTSGRNAEVSCGCHARDAGVHFSDDPDRDVEVARTATQLRVGGALAGAGAGSLLGLAAVLLA